MVLLSRFLQILERLECLAEGLEDLTPAAGHSAISALLSYGSLCWGGCEALDATVLAMAIGLTVHCGLNRPPL